MGLLLLINADGCHIEESILERLGVVVDAIDTGPRARRLTISLTRPVATEGQVNDDIVLVEVLVHVACRAGKEGTWGTLLLNQQWGLGMHGETTHPFVRPDIRKPVFDLRRNSWVIPRPEPDFDVTRRALDGVPSTSCLVEAWPKALRLGEGNRAADVIVDRRVTVFIFANTGRRCQSDLRMRRMDDRRLTLVEHLE